MKRKQMVTFMGTGQIETESESGKLQIWSHVRICYYCRFYKINDKECLRPGPDGLSLHLPCERSDYCSFAEPRQ